MFVATIAPLYANNGQIADVSQEGSYAPPEVLDAHGLQMDASGGNRFFFSALSEEANSGSPVVDSRTGLVVGVLTDAATNQLANPGQPSLRHRIGLASQSLQHLVASQGVPVVDNTDLVRFFPDMSRAPTPLLITLESGTVTDNEMSNLTDAVESVARTAVASVPYSGSASVPQFKFGRLRARSDSSSAGVNRGTFVQRACDTKQANSAVVIDRVIQPRDKSFVQRVTLWDCRGLPASSTVTTTTSYGTLADTDRKNIGNALASSIAALAGNEVRYRNFLATGLLIDDSEKETFTQLSASAPFTASATWAKGTFHRKFHDAGVPVVGLPGTDGVSFARLTASDITARLNSTFTDSVSFETAPGADVTLEAWNKCRYQQILATELRGGQYGS